jgi:DNA-binding transcriptional MerR regulator/methylmalonyl-CoA mutase cobalamin-binding subunit
MQHYPIRTASEMTGINAVTLRAWERRYGLIKPLRTPKGHRLYTLQHIELIHQVREKLDSGMSISRIASELVTRQQDEDSETDIWHGYCKRMIAPISKFDERGVDTVYNEAMTLYPVDIVTNKLIVPLLKQIGELWATENGSVAEEHFFSIYLRNKIGARLHHQNLQNDGKKIVAACMPGERHEFGILLFALNAHSRGYRIIQLGADMPVGELANVVAITQADAIVLAGSAHADSAETLRSLKALVNETAVPVFFGGEAVMAFADKLAVIGVISLGPNIASSISLIAKAIGTK